MKLVSSCLQVLSALNKFVVSDRMLHQWSMNILTISISLALTCAYMIDLLFLFFFFRRDDQQCITSVTWSATTRAWTVQSILQCATLSAGELVESEWISKKIIKISCWYIICKTNVVFYFSFYRTTLTSV